MKRLLTAAALVVGCSAMLPAQSVQSMRASIRGNNSDVGRCTVEVEVDGAADVEIRGDMGYVRTLQGQPSRWRRFECNSPMPRNPVDFRFHGVDGRGSVQLMRDPNSSGGTALVRINDSKGGREGYTFDIEWRGGYGTYSNNSTTDPYYGYGTGQRSRRNDPYNRGGVGPYSSDPYGNNGTYGYGNTGAYGVAPQAVAACQDAVRARARREYGVRNVRFIGANVEDRGNRDRVMGAFDGNGGQQYEYTCRIQENTGQIRDINIRRR